MDDNYTEMQEAAAAAREAKDWSKLPNDILELISSKLCLSDYFVVGSICISWNAAAKSWLKKPDCFRLPWIMLPKDASGRSRSRNFYCLHHNKYCQLPLTRRARRTWCAGSSQGWLIMSHPITKKNFLFNPFTAAQLPLPKHSYTGDEVERPGVHPYYLSKAILTSDPSSDHHHHHQGTTDCLVVAVFVSWEDWYCALGVCRPGDKDWMKWTDSLFDDETLDYLNAIEANNNINVNADDQGDHNELEEDEEPEQKDYDEVDDEEEVDFEPGPVYWLTDIIYYKEKIYGARQDGKVYVFKIITNGDNGTSISWKLLRTTWKLRLKPKFRPFVYLVESICGELLMVVRVLRYSRNKGGWITSTFKVYKLEENDDQEKAEVANWVRVESLGDEQVILVGQSGSQAVCVTAAQVLNGTFRRGNCIYYTESFIGKKPYWDTGVFYLDNPSSFSSEPNLQSPPENYQALLGSYPHSFRYQPFWITPNLTL